MSHPSALRVSRGFRSVIAFTFLTALAMAFAVATASAQQDNFLNGNGSITGTTTFGNATYVPNAVAPVSGAVPQGAVSLTMGTVRNGSGGTAGTHNVGFANNRLVMVYQSNGTTGTPTAGDQTTTTLSSSTAGHWEFARISTVSGSTLNFTAPLIYAYPSGTSQVIAVPEYVGVTLSNTATRVNAQAWDGTSGGVLVILATGAVNFSGNGAEMVATGLGFRGGLSWVNNPGETHGCATTQMIGNATSDPLGFKGEGFYAAGFKTANPASDVKQIGRGNYLQAAGGGNCFNGSGGGGGNAGAGGVGGNTLETDDGDRPGGGMGGGAINFDATAQMPFGGGGGAGDRDDAKVSSGAAGGGVVLLRGGSLTGRPRLTANGANAVTPGTGNPYDGVGGGGAGGVALARMTGAVNCTATSWISAAGGNGADNRTGSYTWSPGGGGGGGRTYIQGSTISANCGPNSNAGNRGDSSGAHGAANGSAGNSTSNATAMSNPTVVLTAPTNGSYTNDSTPTVSGTAGNGATTVQVYVDNVYAATATVSGGNWSVDIPSALTNAGHTIKVFAVNATNNASDTASSTITVDTVNPVVAVSSPVNGNYYATTTPALNYSVTDVNPGANSQCSIDSGAWTNCTSGSNLAALGQGSHTIQVRNTDLANNTGTSSTVTFTVDTIAPTVTLTTPANGAYYNTTTPALSFSVSDANPGANSQCSIDSGTWTNCTSGSNLAALGQGSHTIQVRNTDLAGNVGSSATHTFTVDTVAPGAPTITSGPSGLTGSSSASFTFTGEAGGSYQCYVNPPSSTWTSCTSGVNYTSLAEGAHTFAVRQIDNAGNIGTPATRNFNVDTVAPVVALSAPANGAVLATHTPTVTFSVTDVNLGTSVCNITGPGGPYTVNPCTTGQSLPTLPDGSFSIQVTHTDLAGNVGSSASNAFTIDTTAPAAPTITSGPSGLTNSSSATFTFTGEAGGSYQCYVNPPSSAWTSCTSGVNYTSLADGAHTFAVRQIDDAGNVGAPTTRDFTVDTVNPVVSLSAPADNALLATHTPTVTFSITDANPGTSVCNITGPGGPYSVSPCTSGQSLPSLPDGSFTIQVTHTDQAGNVGSSATHSFTIDTTAPSVTLSAPADNALLATHTPTVTFGVTDTHPGTSTCSVTGPGGPYTVNPCTSGQSLPSLPDGSFTIQVTHTDQAGNVGSSATHSFTIDTTAPSAPSITSPTDGTVTSDQTPTISGNGAEPGSTVTVYNSNDVICTDVADGSGNWSCTPGSNLSEGDYSFTATSTDEAGNESDESTAVDVTIDVTAPGAPTILTPADGSHTADQTPTISGNGAESGSTVTVYEGVDVICTTTADGSGNWSCVPSGDLDEGAHTFTATSTDAADNESSPSSPVTLTIDITAPGAPVIESPADDSTTSDQTPEISGSGAEPGSTVTVYEGGDVICTGAADVNGDWDCTPGVNLNEGSHVFTATSTDGDGNESSPSAPVTVTIDITAPTVALVTPADGALLATSTPTVSFNVTDANPGTSVCNITGPGGPYSVSPCTSGQSLPSLPDGSFTIQVSNTDEAGNVGTSATHSFTIDTTAPDAPVITTPASDVLSNNPTQPISGTAEAGATVTVFDGGTPIGTAVADGSGNWSLSPDPTFTPGAHVITATATDEAGNEGDVSDSVTITIDVTAPGAPSITSPTDGTVTNDQTPTISGDGAEPGSTVTVYNGNDVICTGTADGSGNWSCTPGSNLSEGDYSFTATSTDEAGNESDESTAVDVTIDVTAPSAPSITSPTDGTVTSDQTPTISGNGAEPDSAVTVYNGNDVICTTTADGSGNWSCTPGSNLSEGDYSFTATSTDEAGNESDESTAVDVTIDVTAPGAPSITSPTDGAVTGDATPTVSGDGAEPGSTVTVYEGGDVICTGTADGSGDWSCAPGTDLPDGDHTFTATSTDEAGNESGPSAPVTVTVDTTAPAAPSITSPTDGTATNDPTPTISGSGAEPGSTVTVYEGGDVICTGTADGSGNWNCTPGTDLPDGDHTFTATSTDEAGNESGPSTPVTVTVDTTAPDAPVITTPASDVLSNNPTQPISGTAEAGATVTVFDGGTPIGTAVADGSGNWSLSPDPTFTPGAHVITATATDEAGNEGDVSDSVTLTIDVTAPGAPSITGPADGSVTGDATPTISGDGAEPGSTVTVYEGGDVICTTTADGSGNWSCAPGTDLPDGDHTFTATSTDEAGNESGPSAPVTVTVDTTAPGVPAITSPSDGSVTGDATPTISGDGAEPGSTVTVYEGGDVICTDVADQDGNWDCTPGSNLSEGDHTFTATSTDEAGNESGPSAPVTVTVDTTAPAAPSITSPTDGTVTSDQTPTISGDGAEPGSTVTVYNGNDVICTDVADGSGNWSCTPGSNLSEGDYSFTATSTDEAGNESDESTAVDVTIDVTAPSAPSITGPADGTVTSDQTPTISGDGAEPGSTVTVYEGGDVICTGTADGSGNWSCTPGANLPEGDHTFTATSTDKAGNEGGLSAPVTVTVDTTAPIVTLSAPADGALLNTSTPTVTFSVTDANPGTSVCNITGPGGPYNVSPCTNGQSLPSLPDGTFTIQVTSTDEAGNAGSSSVHTFTIDASAPSAPSITSPTDGTVTSDQTPTISGNGAEPDSAVTVYNGNDVICTTTADGSGNWSCTPGSNLSEGDYSFTATSTDEAGNESDESTAVDVTIDVTAPNAPVITAPTNGSTTNDQTPTISGDGAEPGSTVTVYEGGDVICTDVAGGSGDWSCTPSSNLDEGSHTFTATATDEAGNESDASSPVSVTIDTTAPDTPVIESPADDAVIADQTPTISGSGAEPGSTVTVYEGGYVICTGTADVNGDWNCTPSSNLDEGSHTFTATATDGDDNESSPSAPISITIDVTAPTVTLSGPSDGALLTTHTPSVTFSVTDANPGTSVCNITGPGGPYSVSPCTNGQSLPSLPDGTFTIQVTSTDEAGNAGSSSVHTFTIDTTAPSAPSITSPTDGTVTSDQTPTISGNGAEPGSLVTVYNGNDVICTTTANGGGGWSCTPGSNLPEGDYSFTATSTDAADNESDRSTAVDVTIDVTDPAAPTITGPVDGSVTGDGTPTISGDGAEPGSTVTVYENGDVICTDVADQDGEWSCAPSSNLPDGDHTFTATSTDEAGNEGGPSAPITVTVDTTAPAVTLTAPANGATLTTHTPTVTFSVTDANPGTSVCNITGPGGPYSVSPCTNGQSLPSLPDGQFTIQVTNADEAGNTGSSTSHSFTIDTTAPGAPTITGPEDGDTTNDPTPDVSGSGAEPGSTVKVYENGNVICADVADQDGNWSCAPSTNLGDGDHTFTATSTDTSGHESSPSSPVTVTIDTSDHTPPNAPVITTPANNAVLTTSSTNITGTAEPGSTVHVSLNGNHLGDAVANGSGNWILPSGNLTDGSYTVTATAEDAAGNVSSPSSTVSFTVDATAPDGSVVKQTGTGENGTNPTFDISSNDPDATATCSLDGGPSTPCGPTYTPSGKLSAGEHSLTVTWTDSHGNQSHKTITFVIAGGSDPLPPGCFKSGITITDLSPSGTKATMRGFARLSYAGQTVTIRGSQNPKKVLTTAVVQPDGSFVAKFKAPKKALWNTNKALFNASVGSEKTTWTKLMRRVRTATASYANGKLTVKGVLTKPLMPKAKVKITARSGCAGKMQEIGSGKIKSSGSFSVTLPYANASGVVFVRVAAVVSKGGKKPKPLKTYSYLIPVILGD